MISINLIDLNSFVFRYSKAFQSIMKNGGIYQLLQLIKFLSRNSDNRVIIADDSSDNFRKKINPNYKANRKTWDDEIRKEFSIVKIILEQLGVPLIAKHGYEADDVIYTACKFFQNDRKIRCVNVFSFDSDLFQCLFSNVYIAKFKTNRIEQKNFQQISDEKNYNFPIESLTEYKAMLGDNSDNIRGVPNFGKKTCCFVFNKFKNLANIKLFLNRNKTNCNKILTKKKIQNLEIYWPHILQNIKIISPQFINAITRHFESLNQFQLQGKMTQIQVLENKIDLYSVI